MKTDELATTVNDALEDVDNIIRQNQNDLEISRIKIEPIKQVTGDDSPIDEDDDSADQPEPKEDSKEPVAGLD